MNARTDFAVLRTAELTHRMGARFSAPAERVEVAHELTTMRFSRSLDERHPYVRSSQVQILSEDDPPMDPRDFWFCIAAVACLVAAVGFF